jgi:hypothetical protein
MRGSLEFCAWSPGPTTAPPPVGRFGASIRPAALVSDLATASAPTRPTSSPTWKPCARNAGSVREPASICSIGCARTNLPAQIVLVLGAVTVCYLGFVFGLLFGAGIAPMVGGYALTIFNPGVIRLT